MPRGKSKRRGRGKGNNGGKRRRQGESKDEGNLPSVSLVFGTEINNEGFDGTEKDVVEEDRLKIDQVLEAVRKFNAQVKPVLEEFEKMKKSALKHDPFYHFPPVDSLDNDKEDDTGTSADETEKDDDETFLNMVKAKLRASAK